MRRFFLVFFLVFMLFSAKSNEDTFVFTPNLGQITDADGNARPDIRYFADFGTAQFYFFDDGYSLVHRTIEDKRKLTGVPEIDDTMRANHLEKTHRVDIRFQNANAAVDLQPDRLSGSIKNYYLPGCSAGLNGLQSTNQLTYENLYQGLDLIFRATASGVKYDFKLAPGADYTIVQARYSGYKNLYINENGTLVLQTEMGEFLEAAPYTYLADTKQEVQANFQLQGDLLSFDVESFDRSQALIIDPSIEWSTYMGGSSADNFSDIVLTSTNLLVAVGNGGSTNFPVLNGFQQTNGGSGDLQVVAYDQSGALQWSTYFGGSASESTQAVEAGLNGDVFVAGITASSNLPVSGGYQMTYAGSQDAFIVKFDNSGQRVWASYYGGSRQDLGYGIGVDANGNSYLNGLALSTSGISTPGSNKPTHSTGNTWDGFLVKFNANGVRQWATYVGGSGLFICKALATDAAGNCYSTGYTRATTGVATAGAYQTSYMGAQTSGSYDGYIIKHNTNGGKEWGTYYGSNNSEISNNIATDNMGNVYMIGLGSNARMYTPNGFQTSFGHIFLVKFSETGVRDWGTRIGGSTDSKYGNYDGIACDPSGNVLVSGATKSVDFPTINAVQDSLAPGAWDAFAIQFDPAGNALFSTYLGGSDEDAGYGIAGDALGNVYMSGRTTSLDFPTNSAFQSANAGNFDAYLIKIGNCVNPQVSVTPSVNCNTYEGEILVNMTGGQIPYTLLLSNGMTGGTSADSFTFSQVDTGVFSLTITDANACETTVDSIDLTCFIPPPYDVYYAFDEGSGSTTTDSANNFNDGILSGANWTNCGISGTALHYDGTDDITSVTMPANHRVGDSLTIEAWVKIDSLRPSGMNIISHYSTINNDRSWVLEVASTERILFAIYDRDCNGGQACPEVLQSTASLEPGQWYYIAATYNGSDEISLFLNGQLDTTVFGSYFGLSAVNTALEIGMDNNRGNDDDWFAGTIDEIKLHARPLDNQKIADNWNALNPGLSISGDDSVCFGGAVSLTALGGFAYAWSNGSTNDTAMYRVTSDIEATVTVTDSNGCPCTFSQAISVYENNPISLLSIPTQVSCDSMIGDIALVPSGGTNYFNFMWSTGDTTQNLTRQSPGIYTVTVTDSLGCMAFDATELVPPTDSFCAIAFTFQRIYDKGGTESASAISESADHLYFVAGRTNSFGSGDFDMLLSKIDRRGNEIWSKTYGGSASDKANDLVTMSDGGACLVGETASFGAGGTDFYIVRTNASGDVLWSQTVGGSGNESAHVVKELSNGRIIVAGKTSSFGAGGDDAYVAYFNAQGVLQWSKSYGGSGVDEFKAVVEVNSNNIVLVGETSSYGVAQTDIYLVLIDAQGNSTANLVLGRAGNDHVGDALLTPSGNLMLAGYSNSFGQGNYEQFVSEINLSGQVVMLRTYQFGTFSDADISSLIKLPNGNYGFAGSHNYIGNRNGMLCEVNASGQVMFAALYGHDNLDRFDGMIRSAGGNYVMAGESNSFGQGGTNLYLVKTDSMAIVECHRQSLSVVSLSKSWALGSGLLQGSGGQLNAANTSVVTDSLLTFDACDSSLLSNPCDSLQAICRDTSATLAADGTVCISASLINGGSLAPCGLDTSFIDRVCFTCLDLGRNGVTLTIVDSAGDSSSCIANLDLLDNASPNLLCNDYTTAVDSNGIAVVEVKNIDGGSADSCGLLSLSVQPDTLYCADQGANVVTLIANYSDRNSSTCTATVTVVDDLPPIVNCPDDYTINCGTDDCSITASDVCGGAVTTQIAGISCSADMPNGEHVLTFMATDDEGSTSTCSFTLTVAGNEVPDTLNPKISNLTAGFENRLPKKAGFGSAMSGLGDLNNDGAFDVAIGASASPVVNTRPFKSRDKGDVFIIFLDSLGNVIEDTVIGADLGIEGDSIHKKSKFGADLTGLGDLDGDGVEDLAIAEPGLDPVKLNQSKRKTGGILITFLNSDGTVKSWKRLKPGQNGLADNMPIKNLFGSSIANIGDINGDGVIDIAVGAEFEKPAGTRLAKAGAVYILFMNTDGTVQNTRYISDGSGGLPANTLDKKSYFGSSVAPVGDLNGDGVLDIAVGAWGVSAVDISGKTLKRAGKVFVLLLNSDGTVLSHSEIAYDATKLPLVKKQSFGLAMARIIDTDGDGLDELAVGSPAVSSPGKDVGSVTHILLHANGSLDTSIILPAPAEVDRKHFYGISIGALNDLCYTILGVGAQGDNDVEKRSGAVWMSIPELGGASAKWADDRAPQINDGSSELLEFDAVQGEEPILLKLYPNPNEGAFIIEIDRLSSHARYEIYNLTANLIQHGKFDALTNRIVITQPGVYLIRIKVNDQVMSKKVIVR